MSLYRDCAEEAPDADEVVPTEVTSSCLGYVGGIEFIHGIRGKKTRTQTGGSRLASRSTPNQKAGKRMPRQ